MNALIALRIRVDRPPMEHEVKVASYDDVDSSPATVVASVNGVNQGRTHMEAIQEVELSSKGFRPAPLEVLDHVKINLEPDSPVSTLRNVTGSKETDLSFSKEELRKAEEKLKQAFIEFYQQLRLLKSYCVEGAYRMLVYEYVNNGNLDQWLHGDVGEVSPLTWEIRMNIILGTAKGASPNER